MGNLEINMAYDPTKQLEIKDVEKEIHILKGEFIINLINLCNRCDEDIEVTVLPADGLGDLRNRVLRSDLSPLFNIQIKKNQSKIKGQHVLGAQMVKSAQHQREEYKKMGMM